MLPLEMSRKKPWNFTTVPTPKWYFIYLPPKRKKWSVTPCSHYTILEQLYGRRLVFALLPIIRVRQLSTQTDYLAKYPVSRRMEKARVVTGKVVQCERGTSNLQIKRSTVAFLCVMSFPAQVLYSYSIGFVYILTGLLCVGGLGPAVAFCSEVRIS